MIRFSQLISVLLFLIVTTTDLGCTFSSAKQNDLVVSQDTYQCIPCGYECDKEVYDKPGKCPSCHMELVKLSSIFFKTIQPIEICAYIKEHPDAVLLDVRTKEEFEGKAEPDFGSLKNAVNIPIQEFDTKLSSINSLKNKEIIVYCSHSHRSPQASYILTQNGFTNVTNMAGGMSVVKDNSCKN